MGIERHCSVVCAGVSSCTWEDAIHGLFNLGRPVGNAEGFHRAKIAASCGCTGDCGALVSSMKCFVRCVLAIHAAVKPHAKTTYAACDRASRPRIAML